MTNAPSIVQWAKHNPAIVVIILVIILGLALRAYSLGTESIWLDEAESIYESTLTIAEMSSHSNQPPLYFLILNWWIHLWGTGEIAIRSLSVIFGVLAVFMTYLAGKELFDSKTGLIASFISAISQFYIYHAQDARAYSLLLLLSLVSCFFFIKILKQDKIWHYPCYFLATVLLGYTHIYGIFIIASQIVYFLIFWKKYQPQRIKLSSTIAGTLMCLSPVAILLGPKAMSIAAEGFWIPQPSLGSIGDTFLEYASGFQIPPLTPDSPGTGFTTVIKYILLSLFLILALLNLFFITGKKDKRRIKKSVRHKDKTYIAESHSGSELLLLMLWLFFPILIPFLASYVITPIYLPRYTIVAAPAFYLLVARGTSLFGKKALYCILIATIILSSVGLYQYYKVDIKEQWKEAAELVESRSGKDDIIVFCESYVQRPFDYYYRGELPEFGVAKNTDDENIASSIKDAVGGKERLWLVISNVSELPPVHTYLEERYMLADWWGYRGIVIFLFNLTR